SSWTVIELDSLQTIASGINSPSLALGPAGQPLIAYLKSDPSTPTDQVLAVLEGAGPLGPFTSTAVATEALRPGSLVWARERDRPMILDGASRGGDFGSFEYRVAWRDAAGAWQWQAIGTIPDWPFAGVSLALDPVGNVGALRLDYQYIDQAVGNWIESCGGVG